MRRPTLRTGTRLGDDLTVLSAIDAGSREAVYVAWDHTGWCPVACKIMESSAAAKAEAAMLSKLRHPNIVGVLGVRRPNFLLMPLLEGPTLSSIIDDRSNGTQLSVNNVLRVASHIAAALAHIHNRGFIHLDIKPSNIIIAPGGRPVLVDFGTARTISGPRPSRITGTDGYIAPEEMRLGATGPAADVFSLGVTMYEMLTRQLPFKPKLLSPIVPRAPGLLKSCRKGVTRRMDALIMRCLAEDPCSRPHLPELICELNELITSGPKMWPSDFSPIAPPARSEPQRVASRARSKHGHPRRASVAATGAAS